ncbi:MAG: hypothetical protein H6739_29435 [Alphaproteobacteria bacterium]|nr:hypothetical protein [Alphaproteobacteria bacterium]
MADTIGLGIDIDMSDVARALARLPEMTSEESEKAVRELTRTFDAAAKAAKKLTKQSSREARKAAQEQKEALKGVYELAGGSGDRVEKLGKVFGALSNPVVAAGAAFAGAGVAATALGAGILASVHAAEELVEELAPLKEIEGFGGVSPEAMSSIQAANSSMQALGSIAKQAVVVLATEMAPVVEKVGFTLVKLGLVALDTWEHFSDGEDVLKAIAKFIGEQFVKSLTGPVRLLSLMAKGLALVAEAAGHDGAAAKIRMATDAYDDFAASIAGAGVDIIFEAASEGLNNLSESTSTYDERAQALLGKLTEIRTATEGATKATEDEAKAMEDAAKAAQALAEQQAQLSDQAQALIDSQTQHRLSAIEQIDRAEAESLAKLQEIYRQRLELSANNGNEILAAQVEHQEALAAIQGEYAQRRVDLANDTSEAEKAAILSTTQTQLAAVQQTFGAISTLTDVLLDKQVSGLEEGTEAHKRAAKRQFAIQKGLSIATAVVDAAAAILSSIATLGPPVPPNVIGIAGVAAASAIGAASIATIAATPPPAFDIGGLIGSATPDQQVARVLPGEAILNRSAVSQIGEQGVHALNRGENPNQTLVVNQIYRHRVLDQVIHDSARIPGSSFRKAAKNGDRVGHRTRYRR